MEDKFKESIILDNISDEEVIRWNNEIKEYNDSHQVVSELDTASGNIRSIIEKNCLELIDNYKEEEPRITEMLAETIPLNGYFEGLNHRIKNSKRLMEKVYQDYEKKELDLDNISDKVGDIIRYTIILPVENHINCIDDYLHDLEDYGYSVCTFKNKWPDIYCRGINVILSNPNGTKFEIQFHTKENYAAKEKSREPYNLTRRTEVPLSLRVKGSILRKYLHSRVTVPKGALEYSFESYKKKAK